MFGPLPDDPIELRSMLVSMQRHIEEIRNVGCSDAEFKARRDSIREKLALIEQGAVNAGIALKADHPLQRQLLASEPWEIEPRIIETLKNKGLRLTGGQLINEMRVSKSTFDNALRKWSRMVV